MNVNENSQGLRTGGFYTFDIDGVFKGVVIILFMFIPFDAMIMSQWAKSVLSKKHEDVGNAKRTHIEHFSKTIAYAIQSINTVIFLCLLGMAFALTTIQPVHSLVSFDTLNSFHFTILLWMLLLLLLMQLLLLLFFLHFSACFYFATH